MERKDFLKKGLAGIGGIAALSTAFGLRTASPLGTGEKYPVPDNAACEPSPRETRGPFPNKTPAELLRANITGDRKGIPLLINLQVNSHRGDCKPLPEAWIDIWHCDNQGRYSEYGGGWMQQEDLTRDHFLRGRQQTDSAGRASFISIFPGYYRGRAPHIHLEVLDPGGASILVTQIAFQEAICDQVYAQQGYQGPGYTSNSRDGVFRGSLEQNLADSLDGDIRDGFTLEKHLVVVPAS